MQSLPSPASSPSPTPDLAPHPTRKRQRSQSMQSDASSSSLKRCVADADGLVRSPRPDQMSSLSLADQNQDIDAYMAEQEKGIYMMYFSQLHNIASLGDLPVLLVERGKASKMEIGETWYLVSRDWWKRWRKACTGEVDKEGPVTEQELGPVDNSQLLDSYGNLKLSVVEGVDMEYVPEETWSHLISWYGKASHPLPRRVIARGNLKEPTLELRPLRLKVIRLTSASNQSALEAPSHPHLVISAGETAKTLCTRLAAAVTPSSTTHLPYRVWQATKSEDDWNFDEFPSSHLESVGGRLLEESSKTLQEISIEPEDGFIVEFKQLNGWIVDLSKPASSANSAADPPPLFDSRNSFFGRFMPSTPAPVAAPLPTTSTASSKMAVRSSTTPFRSTKPMEPGTLGLGNMGNTCFMNSALQCLAHTKELSDYFLTGVYQDELNPDNPLGMGGAIAEAFGALLQKIWSTDGSSTTFSPREFKSQLQRFAPQFSGYQQHDSQELVAFLLDGLHEDLNRVLKKPYVEKPDWEGGGDLELIELARKSWEGYMMRNDSVIVDLFQGQYQSTLVCPECNKVSITFDPFMYLTLPLPVQKKWKHTVYYIPWSLEKPHVKVPVEIGRDASFKDLRVLLGRWMEAPPDNLLTLEIFNNRFYKYLDDNVPCGDMSSSDIIVCFELPCHAQQSRSYKRQPDDPFIVPMFLCEEGTHSRTDYTMNRTTPMFGNPTVVVIDQKKATDLDAMYEAVVSRMERWTAHARDLYTWEAGPIHINGIAPTDSITEINEQGEAVTMDLPEEGDIVDEKTMVLEDDVALDIPITGEPRRVGAKTGIFKLRLQINHKKLGTTQSFTSNNRWESWDRRLEDADHDPVLLREDDAFYCEFDENMKAYYFGDERSRWEHARWDTWEEFIHPELDESKREAAERKNKGLSLQDCLDEFTKEERLGEDDLWYCPQCKKHQQATKKFDLWKAPDVLVVHLKRFSNSRTLRDKIDTFIDFPIEGLDLGDMVGERAAAKRLIEQGIATEELNLGNTNEPLVYDLYGVDEHIGGLGGGHYRAYTFNHATDKWYHFDDSYVTPARASDSVNANAYLLFYRRRTSAPLGGKTHEKVQEAQHRHVQQEEVQPTVVDNQLPTPPDDEPKPNQVVPGQWLSSLTDAAFDSSRTTTDTFRLRPPLADINDPLAVSSTMFDFPEPPSQNSPTSSNEVEPDLEERDENNWWLPKASPEWDSGGLSPSSSSISGSSPFDNANLQKFDDDDTDMPPLDESIL
ncbi:hypothetical protein BD779DRAFT_1527312 [Infundibulicybe gibba]|nr:hypothetical protein BD779DRAFT_1527312 [Infundibulicybe gibba]